MPSDNFNPRISALRALIPMVVLASWILSACNPAPAYRRPNVPIAPAYHEAQTITWRPAVPADWALRGDWWARYQDPGLTALEARVDAENQSLAAATADYFAARAAVRAAKAQYWPVVSTAPSVTNERIAAIAIPGVTSSGFETSEYSLPLTASWEPDIWARVRNTVSSGTYGAQASAAEMENVRLLAHGALAVDYFELRGVEEQQRILRTTVHVWQQEFDLTRNLYQSGLANDENLAAAESQLKTAQAQEAELESSREQYVHAIAVLLGQSPSNFTLARGKLPEKVPRAPIAIPAELLQRRPDIAAAERGVAQANAEIGVARSAYFPNILLSGTSGFQSLSAAAWMSWPSRFWSVGPSAAETVFDAGARRANVKQYRELYEAALANYRQTSLTAFQQVEDQLATLNALSASLDKQKAAVKAAARFLDEANARYVAGLDSFLNVLTARNTLLTYQQNYVTLRTEQLVASIQLIEALGGGWNASQLPSRKQIAANKK